MPKVFLQLLEFRPYNIHAKFDLGSPSKKTNPEGALETERHWYRNHQAQRRACARYEASAAFSEQLQPPAKEVVVWTYT
jgi:hypothetical protein